MRARHKAIKEDMYTELVKYQQYTKDLMNLAKVDTKIPETVALDLMNQNQNLMNNDIFLNEDLGWEASDVSRKAMAKFNKMVMKNDYKKLKYYAEIIQHGQPALTIKEVMDMPVPTSVEHTPENFQNLKEKMNVMSERLKKLDDNWHINSAEFKAMKEAFNNLNKTLGLESIDNTLLGEQLEKLQAASMNYIQKKGVGTQSTTLGQDRMDFALDICQDSADFMDIYASKERRAELKEVLDKALGKEVVQAGVSYGAPVYTEEIQDLEDYEDAIRTEEFLNEIEADILGEIEEKEGKLYSEINDKQEEINDKQEEINDKKEEPNEKKEEINAKKEGIKHTHNIFGFHRRKEEPQMDEDELDAEL